MRTEGVGAAKGQLEAAVAAHKSVLPTPYGTSSLGKADALDA